MARSQGYHTKTRQLILTYLQDNRRHAVSAANILAYLADNDLPTSPTTVYRYLDKLVAENRIMKYVADKGEKAVYQYVDEGAHCQQHLHLKCIECGQIYHLDCSFMDDVRSHLMKSHGFELECVGSILYGLCANCRAKHAQENGTTLPDVPQPEPSHEACCHDHEGCCHDHSHSHED